jgi:cell division transport system ATP-binding protein
MLKIENLKFDYRGQPVLNNLSLEVKEGEFVFLIGKSGCGKTTLLQLIYLNILPQSGSIEFAGYNSSGIKPGELPYLRRKLGVIFQDFKLLEDRNVYENLAFVLEVTGMKRSEIRKRILNVLSDVGLTHKQKNMPHQLSGGEQQRIAIARAIINKPLLILADEPTGNLDPETSDEIIQILKKINNRGTSILFATHNYTLLKHTKARIMKIDDGRAKRVNVRYSN